MYNTFCNIPTARRASPLSTIEDVGWALVLSTANKSRILRALEFSYIPTYCLGLGYSLQQLQMPSSGNATQGKLSSRDFYVREVNWSLDKKCDIVSTLSRPYVDRTKLICESPPFHRLFVLQLLTSFSRRETVIASIRCRCWYGLDEYANMHQTSSMPRNTDAT